VALLQRIRGMDEEDARDLLRAAGMNVELAVDAWLEADEQLVKNRVAGNAVSRGERLAIARPLASGHGHSHCTSGGIVASLPADTPNSTAEKGARRTRRRRASKPR
jgi:hypothetical protein